MRQYRKKSIKKLFVVMLILTLGFLSTACDIETAMELVEEIEQSSTTIETIKGQGKTGNDMKVHFIDVGQGDSIFIDYGDYDILIDGGNNGDGDLVVNYLKKLHTDDIEILIGTHPHADHIGGLDDVLEAFTVEKIIDSGLEYDSKTYEEYLASAKQEESAELIYDDNIVYQISEDVTFKIIETGDKFKDTNDYSVVSVLDYNDIEFLFTGDMESHTELESLGKFSDIDVLKVAHHGSKSSTTDDFLNVTKPEYGILSCGKDNRYGHPHKETIEKLQSRGINIFRTDEQGHIIVTTDGKTLDFQTINTDN